MLAPNAAACSILEMMTSVFSVGRPFWYVKITGFCLNATTA